MRKARLIHRARHPTAAAAGSALGAGDGLARVHALLTRRPPLPRGRFDALVGDLSAVLRGEAEADVLLAYEM
jgi:hypothetical protein